MWRAMRRSHRVALFPLGVAVWIAASAVAAGRASPGAWRDHLLAGRTALGDGDLVTARAELTALDSICGGHSGAMYALAQIAARSGERNAMLRWLEDAARTGLERHVADDTSFAAFANDPSLQAMAARLLDNGRAVAKAQVVTGLYDAKMLPEDVVWDATGKRYLVSSIHWRKIMSVTSTGVVEDFIRPARADLWGIYGLALDAARGRLWATTAAEPSVAEYEPADSNRTALVQFAMPDGRFVEQIELPRDGAHHVLGDLCLGPDGTVYVSESIGGAVYRLTPGSNTLTTLVPSGTFVSPQRPVLALDGKRLLVPDYARGIAAVTLRTGEVQWLAKPRTLASGGIDGIYALGADLIAIQNGTTPHRVLALDLDAAQTKITSWRVLEQASPDLGEPNHGVLVGRDFTFIGNSGWDRVGAADTLVTPPGTAPPVLLKLEKVSPH